MAISYTPIYQFPQIETGTPQPEWGDAINAFFVNVETLLQSSNADAQEIAVLARQLREDLSTYASQATVDSILADLDNFLVAGDLSTALSTQSQAFNDALTQLSQTITSQLTDISTRVTAMQTQTNALEVEIEDVAFDLNDHVSNPVAHGLDATKVGAKLTRGSIASASVPYLIGIPGTILNNPQNGALTANALRLTGFRPSNRVKITEVWCYIRLALSPAYKVRHDLYLANSSGQASGASLLPVEFAVTASYIGWRFQAVDFTLEPNSKYMQSALSDAAAPLEAFVGSSDFGGIVPGANVGTDNHIANFFTRPAALTYADGPTAIPATAWETVNTATTGFRHVFLYKFEEIA